MARTADSSGTESRQRTLPLDLCRAKSSEADLNGSNDAMAQSYCSTPQSPQAVSDQTVEERSRSAHNGLGKTLPGIAYVFGKATGPEAASSGIQQQASGNTPAFDSSNHYSGRSHQQSPSTSGSCASTSETRHYHGESMDCLCHSLEITNHSAAGSLLFSRSEESGRRLVVKFAGSRDIGDEGLCHIYDDGTYIPAYVNGEWVTPALGLTKSGKPRKRLEQACKSCNGKKVKCEPGHPKCRQCEKTQIDCV